MVIKGKQFAIAKWRVTMDYISAKQAAEKWGITVRWVQHCCKSGLIPGAGRLGNSWIIPKDALKPNTEKRGALHPNQCMPLMNRSFEPGGLPGNHPADPGCR